MSEEKTSVTEVYFYVPHIRSKEVLSYFL